jgi:signal transduction histidine kinase
VALLALASEVIGLIGLRGASNAAAVLVQDAQMIQHVQEIRVAVSRVLGPPAEFYLTGDVTSRGRYTAAVGAAFDKLAAYSAAHELHRHSVEHAMPAQELTGLTASNLDEISDLEAAIFETDSRAGGAASLAELQSLVATTVSRLDVLLQDAEEDIESAESALAAVERNAFIGLSISALLAIALGIGLAWRFTRSIGTPMAELARAADRFAGGDFSAPVSIHASGEIGRLADAFERMRETVVRERGQQRLLAVLEERDRIGREMHDGLAQVLGYVNTKAQAVGQYLKSEEPQMAERHIDELVMAAREAYTDAREVIVGLRLDGAGQRGLSEMLLDYIEQFTRRNQMAAHLELSPLWADERLSPTAQVQLLRIVQEALTNVRKHASASQVRVSLDVEQAHAMILIEDDGDGFNLSSLLRPEFARFGLRTMRERTHAIDGNFRIESSPGNGTKINVRLPLEGPAKKERA